MRIDIATLFDGMCLQAATESIVGRAVKAGKLEIFAHQIRAYTLDKFGRTDFPPYGGGMGMLMQADALARCCDAIIEQQQQRPHIIYLSPKGRVFNQQRALELSKLPSLLLVCGHYEGVDQRFIDAYVDEEISIGDYVLTGGELGALVVCDAVARLCDGVLSSPECYTDESHFNGLLEYPQYTRPPVWRERGIPEVLVSGHHANIARWRRTESLLLTRKRRPDLFAKLTLTKQEIKWLAQLEGQEKAQADAAAQAQAAHADAQDTMQDAAAQAAHADAQDTMQDAAAQAAHTAIQPAE